MVQEQELTLGQQLVALSREAAKVLTDEQGLTAFRTVLMQFLPKLSPHLVMQDMGTAPKDRPILALLSHDEPPCIIEWQEYEKTAGEETDEDGETGFWCFKEDLIADVCGAADPVGWWELPDDLQSIARTTEKTDG